MPAFFRRGSAAGQRVATVLHVLGCAVGIAGAAVVLFGRDSVVVEYAWRLPSGIIRLAVDRLSAFFLMPVFVVSALGSVYGEGYWSEPEHPDNARKLRCFYGIATAGLLIVMVAGDAWTFLIGWEVVGLAAFFLVTTEQDDAEALRAGWIYLIATHTATLVLFAMFALLRQATGTWLLLRPKRFGSSPLLTPILLLALLGFGIKAGVMPFHVWLPGAHAAAPSHVSAILSGVVLKMGIYGLVRTLSLLPAFPEWLGLALLALGIISGVLGVVLALAQHDLKRLLAYHSVENIGIILIGLGVGVLGIAQHQPAWAVLGFAGGLLHVWNHAAFKSLLFYSAGAVVRATGTRDLDALGGLLRRMRFTGAMFLIGAVAICGLPPLNGFVSEWLIYLGSFRSSRRRAAEMRSRPPWPRWPSRSSARSPWPVSSRHSRRCSSAIRAARPEAAFPGDASASMKWPMGLLAAACCAIGLLPRAAGDVSRGAAQALLASVQPPFDAALPELATVTFLLLALLGSCGAAATPPLLPPRGHIHVGLRIRGADGAHAVHRVVVRSSAWPPVPASSPSRGSQACHRVVVSEYRNAFRKPRS